MMFMKSADTFEPWTDPARAAFEFWIGLWPVAPMFGVEWRFGDTVVQFNPFIEPPAEYSPKPAAKPASKRASKPVVIKTKTVTESAPVLPAPVVEPVAVEKTVAIEPEPAAKPVIVNPAAPLAQAPADPDDLTVIKGIGPGLAGQLNGQGIYKFSQIANFSKRDLTRIDKKLTAFKGRCFRDDWVGQAKAIVG